jgi:hypothetical protein
MQHRSGQISTRAHEGRQSKRRQIEEVLALAEYLPQTDRILVEQLLGHGQPVAKLAKLYRMPPRQLQRRADMLIKRLSNKLFKFVAIQPKALPIEVRPIARQVVLHGISMRKTAQISGLSLHKVRQYMNTVQATARLFS